MKLYRNKYIQIIYFLLAIPILLFIPLLSLEIIDPDTIGSVFMVLTLIFFLFTLITCILIRKSTKKDKLITFGSILIIPLILLFQLFFIKPDAWQAAIFLLVILINIQGGVLFKWNYTVFIFSILYIALSFKMMHIPGADFLLASIAPLVLINLIMELFRVQKYSKYKKEYLKLFYTQGFSYLSLTISFWFIFFHIGGPIIGKALIYFSFAFNLVFLLLLPKSEFINWDSDLKKRFRFNNIYAGIAFFLLALVFIFSDIIGYDIMNLMKDSYFIDYPINFHLPAV